MKKLLLLLILFPVLVKAQTIDDFSDGDFSNNPTWTGNTNSFIINSSQQLQLNSSGSDTSILVTPLSMQSNIEWQFWIKLSFSPSDNNNLRVYLVSNQADLKIPLNGYYIKCGESGSDDSIDLYRQDGSSSEKIIDGIDAHCSSSTNTIRIKVIRHSSGDWELFSDISGENAFISEGIANDTTYQSGDYFGVFCKYTSSNATKFYFDDFYIGDIQVDTIPPAVISYNLTSNNTIELSFSEALDTAQSEQTSNYNISNGIGMPAAVSINNLYPDKVELLFTDSFVSGQNYELSISNINDIAGNIMPDTTVVFSYFQISENDIVINEVMADPYPPVSLPEQEYIELYNNSNFDIEISNWTIEIGNSEKSIPDFFFEHDSYLILCSTAAAAELENYGNTLAVPGFTSLTNTGQYLALINDEGLIISEISYSLLWYQDAGKEDGGWSLERIDPNNNCGEMSNWKASIDIRGGSPGIQNSVFANNIDTVKPFVESAFIDDYRHIFVSFAEDIKPEDLTNTANYFIESNQSNPTFIEITDNQSVLLSFADSFINNTTLDLSISSISDLCDNEMNDTSLNLLFHQAQQWDIIINEIMADPSPMVNLPESDYLELYNSSDYTINFAGWSLLIDKKQKEFISMNIEPGNYIILCPEGNCPLFGQFVNCLDILGSNDLTNDGKTLALIDKKKRVVSSVAYSSSWYNGSYKEEGGWSLERIDPANFCEAKANWLPSENSNGGTPGQQNSVFSQNPDIYTPIPTRALFIDMHTIELIFSEQMDSISLTIPGNYLVGDLGNPVNVKPLMPLYQSVILQFADSFEHNKIYTLEVSNTWDCMANINEPNTVRFAVPEEAAAFDIVINEVLFNPIDDGVDYIELYNRSDKCIDMQNLVFAVKDEYSGLITSTKEISTKGFLLFPKDYLVLTSSKEKVLEQYYTNNANAFISPDIQLPTMANDKGRIILMSKGNIVIDDFSYNEDMQFALLTSFDGVSLERINYNFPTTNVDNWHSAAESVGFGTPGLQNSQFSEQQLNEAVFELAPEVFSPDNDGHDDVLNISYKFEKAGYVGTITVYNAKGRLIKRIANNELLATEGNYVWDGLTDGNRKAEIGIYLIVLNYFDLKGNSSIIKKTCVLAGKL